MWKTDRDLFKTLSEKCGSTYMAVQFLAKGSRRLAATLPPGVIESKLITWVLTGSQPDIEAYLLNRQRCYIEMQNISDMLEYVADSDIQDCVIASYKSAVKQHHLVYKYKSNMAEANKIRVRILTRMAWYD